MVSPHSGSIAQQRVHVGQLLFSSDFDSGNMGRVDRFPSPSEPAANNISMRSYGCNAQTSCEEYVITVAPDCCGMQHENNYRTWFYFGVKVAVSADLASSGKVPTAMATDSSAASSAVVEAMPTSLAPLPEENQNIGKVSTPSRSRFLDCDMDRNSESAEGSQHGQDMMSEEELENPRYVCFDTITTDHAAIDNRGGFQQAEASTASDTIEDSATPVALLEENIRVQLAVTGMNNQGKLFKQGWRPWFRNLPCSPKWQQLPDNAEAAFSYEWGGDIGEGGSGMTIRWRQHLLCDNSTYYFAFCAPLGYKETRFLIHQVENVFVSRTGSLECLADVLQDDWAPGVGQDIYFHRQDFHHTPENRIVDLLTITSDSCESDCMECYEDPPHELQLCGDLPRSFASRPIVFISARVHPGETPAQFTFFGTLRFLISSDPRAVHLRNSFTFKMIPILNPDGVARGHYRTNVRGLNLNRYYDHPTQAEHEAVWATKVLLTHWAAQHRLLFYLDLHAHATKRGCFFLANKLGGKSQAWNMGYARLMQINSPYFDLDHCTFADGEAALDKGRDGLGKEGSGRASIHRDCNICHAYTLECNYHSARISKAVTPVVGISASMESPSTRLPTSDADVKYTPATWGQVGEALCISILDLYGHNCYSRLPQSRFGSVARLLSSSPSLRERSGCRKGSDVMPHFHEGVSIEAVSSRERCCGHASCCWRTHGRPPSKGFTQKASYNERRSVGAESQRKDEVVRKTSQRHAVTSEAARATTPRSIGASSVRRRVSTESLGNGNVSSSASHRRTEGTKSAGLAVFGRVI